MENNLKEKIENQIKNFIVLYMKGTIDQPACGFSAKALTLIAKSGVKKEDVTFFNVLEDNELREGIKEYSQWPTIPQLYINGEFIGGADIMNDLFKEGALQKMLVKN